MAVVFNKVTGPLSKWYHASRWLWLCPFNVGAGYVYPSPLSWYPLPETLPAFHSSPGVSNLQPGWLCMQPKHKIVHLLKT